MTWVRVDDSFAEHAKVLALSDAAVVMWIRCACWAQREENRHTRGFIPSSLLSQIARLPAARAKRLAAELVGANAGGTKAYGLWETCDGGWRFHDWDVYQPPEKLTREESARRAGQRSAEARRIRHGTAQPRTSPNERETFGERSGARSDGSFDERRSAFRSTNVVRTSRTPDPDPDPDPDPPKDFERDPKDLPGCGAEPTPQRLSARNLGEALGVPIRDRSSRLLDEWHLAEWVQPHRWPELVAIAERFSTAMGWVSPRMTGPSPTVRRLVELLAAYDPDELERAAAEAPRDTWLTSGRKGLGSLTVEVVGRLLSPQRASRTGLAVRQPDYDGETTYSLAEALRRQETSDEP